MLHLSPPYLHTSPPTAKKNQDDNFSTHQLKAFYDFEYNTLLCLELASALAMHTTYKSFKRSKEQGKPRRYSDLVMPLAYAICSAIIGTQSVVNAKCLSELLTLTFQGQSQMVSELEQRTSAGGSRGGQGQVWKGPSPLLVHVVSSVANSGLWAQGFLFFSPCPHPQTLGSGLGFDPRPLERWKNPEDRLLGYEGFSAGTLSRRSLSLALEVVADFVNPAVFELGTIVGR